MSILHRRGFVLGLGAASWRAIATLASSRSRVEAYQSLDQLPALDGAVTFDTVARRAASTDYGGHVTRMPLAVLEPGSVDDVVRIVQHANRQSLKVAMRGQGCSVSGQSQVDGGIVIDSRHLKNLRWQGDAVDAEPGASWGDVVELTVPRGSTPPVMVDALALSVGGTLSVGGNGEAGFRRGAQVDHVLELDVVTGAGQLVTCSPSRNPDLFAMTLAGLGQCGLIVRARLAVTRAPGFVVLHRLRCGSVDALVSDLRALSMAEAVDHLGAEITPAGNVWQYMLTAGVFLDTPDGAATAQWRRMQLKSSPEASPVTMTYREYLDRRTVSVARAKSGDDPRPNLAVLLPAAPAASFLSGVLSAPDRSAGIWRIEVLPMLSARFRQPLHRVPAGPVALALRIQRRASQRESDDHRTMLRANLSLVEQALASGGAVYPPFAPMLSRAQWERHYGAATWKRLTTAKRRFDPNNILTPGAGLF